MINFLKDRLKAIFCVLGSQWNRPGFLGTIQPVNRQFGFGRGQPIDRFYIEQFIRANVADIQGCVLEFSNSLYTRKFGGDRVAVRDVLNMEKNVSGTTIVADLAHADHIPSDRYDCIICTQVLQFIYDVEAAVAHLHRILKPGGVVLVTVPFISKRDPNWDEYWRFTSMSAKRLFNEAFGGTQVTVQSYGNVKSSSAFLYGFATQDLKKTVLDYADPEYEMLIAIKAVKLKG